MKLKLYFLVVLLGVCIVLPSGVFAQGCVAVKNMATCPLSLGNGSANKLQISLNYRYFRSYKHFVGNEEQKERVEEGTEVINHDNSVNLGLSYSFTDRFSVSAIVPYVFIQRSSMYEHLGNSSPENPRPSNPNYERFYSSSTGFGDVRLIAYYTLIQPNNSVALVVGAGVKLPTGDYHEKDTFTKPAGPTAAYVDQSIQAGDGGFGQILEVDLSIAPLKKLGGYVNGFYMTNPMNTNGVQRSPSLTKNSNGDEIPLSNEFSVADQYMLRAGGRYNLDKFQAFLGGRMECIPSKDLIGKSEGFRRPGYVISIEPSAFYTFGDHTVGFSLPFAVERNRTRSQIDIARGNNPETGKPYHGDAAFADWLLSVTYAYRIPMK